MKRFESKFKCAAIFIFLLLTNTLRAQQSTGFVDSTMDSVEVSLLTCQPRQNVYSLYGHTALRIQDKKSGTDWAVNYGMFSFSKPFFVLRFVFGLTDYEMGIEPFEDFRRQYEYYGCGVRQQVISLTSKEKAAFLSAIARNYEPENRVYRYNYFYDNCTTRARDILYASIDGKISTPSDTSVYPSYRKMTHRYNEQQRWARFGNDLLLGVKADASTNQEQQQFLPDHLMRDFDKTVITDAKGNRRALVSKAFWIIQPQTHAVETEFPLTPTQCALIFAALVVLFTVYESYRHRDFWWLDTILLLADGLCGLILLAMVFSEHPTVSLNLQILLLCPLSLVFLYPSVKSLRRGRLHVWLRVFPLLILLFLAGGLFQSYAEGMYIVALSLLIRYTTKTVQHLKTTRNKQTR